MTISLIHSAHAPVTVTRFPAMPLAHVFPKRMPIPYLLSEIGNTSRYCIARRRLGSNRSMKLHMEFSAERVHVYVTDIR